jgi:hydroxyethylthiazole kinase-like uncharacterized protein yjeF
MKTRTAIVTRDETRILDDATAADAGTPGASAALMVAAGTAVADAAERLAEGGRIVIVAGTGQNGGDALVAGWTLQERGVPVTIVVVGERGAIAGDARAQLDRVEAMAIPGFDIRTDDDLAALDVAFDGVALIVDGMFGIGAARPIDGFRAAVIGRVNDSAARRLAIDVPSGIHPDTGELLGVAVQADVTLAIGGIKRGCVRGAGIDHAGKLEVFDLWDGRAASAELLAFGRADAELVRPRPLISEHKGKRGHVVVVGGNPGYRGAGQLAALGALRAGAGLCTLAARPDGTGEVSAPIAVMTEALAVGGAPTLPERAVVVLGPGLGRDAGAARTAAAVLAAGVPVVADADVLQPGLTGAAVITPHPKEAARMLGSTVEAVEGDRVVAARELAAATGAVVVLKGARTVVADGVNITYNLSGSPALATGGSGDVLAGVIAALIAQGLSPADAARFGVYVHARAGELLEARFGRRGAIASDLPEAIACAIDELA